MWPARGQRQGEQVGRRYSVCRTSLDPRWDSSFWGALSCPGHPQVLRELLLGDGVPESLRV